MAKNARRPYYKLMVAAGFCSSAKSTLHWKSVVAFFVGPGTPSRVKVRVVYGGLVTEKITITPTKVKTCAPKANQFCANNVCIVFVSRPWMLFPIPIHRQFFLLFWIFTYPFDFKDSIIQTDFCDEVHEHRPFHATTDFWMSSFSIWLYMHESRTNGRQHPVPRALKEDNLHWEATKPLPRPFWVSWARASLRISKDFAYHATLWRWFPSKLVYFRGPSKNDSLRFPKNSNDLS